MDEVLLFRVITGQIHQNIRVCRLPALHQGALGAYTGAVWLSPETCRKTEVKHHHPQLELYRKQSRYKVVARMTSPLKMEGAIAAAAAQDAEGAKWRQFATVIWNACGLDEVLQLESQRRAEYPEAERPFLQPLAWALFSAYRQVLARPVAELAAMRAGGGAEMLADPKLTLDLVKSALPHQQQYIDTYGTSGLPYLVDELEETLLRELRRSLYSPDFDQASVEQAAAILSAAENLASASQKSIKPPAGTAAQ